MFDILGGTLEIFELVLASDGHNEGSLTMAQILIAQFALLLCGIISVCYIWSQRWDSVVSSPVQSYNQVTREDTSLTCYSVRLSEFSGANIPATKRLYEARKLEHKCESV